MNNRTTSIARVDRRVKRLHEAIKRTLAWPKPPVSPEEQSCWSKEIETLKAHAHLPRQTEAIAELEHLCRLASILWKL